MVHPGSRNYFWPRDIRREFRHKRHCNLDVGRFGRKAAKHYPDDNKAVQGCPV